MAPRNPVPFLLLTWSAWKRIVKHDLQRKETLTPFIQIRNIDSIYQCPDQIVCILYPIRQLYIFVLKSWEILCYSWGLFPILVRKIKFFSALYNPRYGEYIVLVKTVAFFLLVFVLILLQTFAQCGKCKFKCLHSDIWQWSQVYYNAFYLEEKQLHVQISPREYAWTVNKTKIIQEPQGTSHFLESCNPGGEKN